MHSHCDDFMKSWWFCFPAGFDWKRSLLLCSSKRTWWGSISKWEGVKWL